MVVQAAMLVIGDEQQRLSPAGTAADGVVDRLDELLTERDVVVRVLAVSRRSPARLEEGVRRQRARGRVGLEVGELPETGLGCTEGIGEVLPGQRLFVIAVDLPAQVVRGHQAEDALHGVGRHAVVHVPLARRGAGEGPVREGLGRHRAIPVVADREAGGQAGEHRQPGRSEHPHDLRGRRAGLHAALRALVIADRVSKARDETIIGRHRRAGRVTGAEQLRVGVRVSLTGIGARHEISPRSRVIDLVYRHRIAACVGIRLTAGQAFEVRRVGIQESQHVVKRAILEHELDDVLNRRQLVTRHVYPHPFPRRVSRRHRADRAKRQHR